MTGHQSVSWPRGQSARSVSAVRLITEAVDRGIPVFDVHAGNLATVLPQLQVSSEVVDDVRNAVAAGKRAVIPRENVPFLDWNGVGYIVLDPDTGAAAYLISGGLAGAATAERSDLQLSLELAIALLDTTINALVAFLTKAANSQAAAVIAKVIDGLGKLFTALNVMLTAAQVLEKTGSLGKAILAGLVDFAASVAAGVFIITAAAFIATFALPVAVTVGLIALTAAFFTIGFGLIAKATIRQIETAFFRLRRLLRSIAATETSLPKVRASSALALSAPG